MPSDKDLKRRVRARMSKTGEAYTSARAQILRKPQPGSGSAEPARDYAAIAGMSDDAVLERTGRTWAEWVAALDAVDATTMQHRDIARCIHDNHEISGWWAQMVTVAYERIRGLRAKGQRRDGTYDASRSKTFPVPVGRLYRAFASKRERQRWLTDADADVTTTRKDKTVRLLWPDGSRVHAYFTAKGEAKSQVAVQHGKLPSEAARDEAKELWGRRLAALGEVLGEGR